MGSFSDKKLRIAIVGGGIGGLTCAIALKNRTDVEIDLYESAAELTEIGAGITIWPRTWKIFQSMGLEEDMKMGLWEKPKNKKELVWTFRKSDQKEGFNIYDFYENGNGLSRAVHRQDMQHVLLNHLPSFCQVHLKHRLDHYEEDEEIVKLYFQNGTVSTHDVVIGADGVKSTVRKSHLARSSPLVDDNGILYTGTVCYRGLIPREKLEALCPRSQALKGSISYCGKSKHVVAYPISKGTIINVGALYTTPADAGKPLKGPQRRDATIDEILEQYSDWEEDVKQLLSALENPIAWAIQELVPLGKYVTRRMVLVGDAAHAMSPHIGAGAGVAIEDAYVLGTLLSRSSCPTGDIPRILDIYNTVRQPHGNYMMKAAHEMINHYEFLDFLVPEYEGVKDSLTAEQMACFADAVVKGYSWGWGDPEIELKRAIEML